MLIAWFIFFCSNKVIALKKVIGQMMRKHCAIEGHNLITEFSKRKTASKHPSWLKGSNWFVRKYSRIMQSFPVVVN